MNSKLYENRESEFIEAPASIDRLYIVSVGSQLEGADISSSMTRCIVCAYEQHVISIVCWSNKEDGLEYFDVLS